MIGICSVQQWSGACCDNGREFSFSMQIIITVWCLVLDSIHRHIVDIILHPSSPTLSRPTLNTDNNDDIILILDLFGETEIYPPQSSKESTLYVILSQ